METVNSKRIKFLEFIKDTYKPSLIYYPACGFDKVPKKVFGANHVIHLSLEEDESDSHYFEKLGDGIKIFGNLNNSPLADNSVDMILIHFSGVRLSPNKMLEDFYRILKPDGIIVIDEDSLTYKLRKKLTELLTWFKNYQEIPLPEEFKKNQLMYGVYKHKAFSIDGIDDFEKGQYLESKEKMINFTKKNSEYRGFKQILDYAVFRKN